MRFIRLVSTTLGAVVTGRAGWAPGTSSRRDRVGLGVFGGGHVSLDSVNFGGAQGSGKGEDLGNLEIRRLSRSCCAVVDGDNRSRCYTSAAISSTTIESVDHVSGGGVCTALHQPVISHSKVGVVCPQVATVISNTTFTLKMAVVPVETGTSQDTTLLNARVSRKTAHSVRGRHNAPHQEGLS